MSTLPLDSAGQAREALSNAVSSFGPRILSNPQMLENVFRDLLPDSPREVSLLVTAAQADVAALLQDRIGQHMDPDTAVRLTASVLGERRALDGAACLWATAEFARALGYSVSETPAAAPSGPPIGEGSEARGWGEEMSASPLGGAPPPGTGPLPHTAGEGDDRTRTQGAGLAGDAVFTPAGAAAAGGGAPSGPPGSRRNLLIGAAVVVVVAVGVVVALLARHSGGKSTDSTTTTRIALPTTTLSSSTTVPSSTTTPPLSLTSLSQLVPGDDQNPTTCSTNPVSASLQGVVSSLRCADPDLNSEVYAIQFQTFAEYEQSLASLNASQNFNPANVAPTCPAGSATQGEQAYSFQNFPPRAGQVVECFIDTAGLTYLWTLPSQNAYLLTTTANFSTVKSWWAQQFADPSF